MENVNGLLFDASGICRGIEVPISNEPVTDFGRVARHESLTIGPTLQMIQRIRIVRLNEAGVEMCQVVKETVMNPNVQAQLLNAYQDSFYPASTEGAFVDPETGMPVAQVEGAVEQLQFFQGITVGVLKAIGTTITDATSVPMLVYGLLKSEILKLDAQGRL